MPELDQMPGFRRRFRVTPGKGCVRSAVEDDFHCMSVVIRHENGRASSVEPIMERAPWSTCPGAVQKLCETFSGVALEDFARTGGKTSNCTHLFDLALLGAAHAQDEDALVYDVRVSDPVGGVSHAELRRNGERLLLWTQENGRFTAPGEIAGMDLMGISRWIHELDPALQEAARVLRWAAMIAHGRIIPLEQQSDARRMPANCYTFQPERAAVARRVGESRDFSSGSAEPLGNMEQL